jgi:hypothetical protein
LEPEGLVILIEGADGGESGREYVFSNSIERRRRLANLTAAAGRLDRIHVSSFAPAGETRDRR